ncbi:MAG TPA: HDOD domain-containing protein, partial [Phycisphaerae bacterium]|nr:HDOD domain-containing protein [Phycisphaerae bacterium]
MSDSQLEILLGQIRALPTLPVTAARLLELAETAERDPQAVEHLEALLGADPAIAAKLLSLAGTRREDFARTVPAAIELLGRPAAIAAAISLELLDATDADPKAGTGMDLREFWRHCLGVALAAREIARAARLGAEGDLAFACGLLHDLGKLALAVTMPKSYRRAIDAAFLHKGNIAAYEQKILGVRHCVAGRRLAEQWRLPQAVQDVLWMHHQPLEAIPPAMPHRRLCAVVALADALCRRGRIGSAGNFAAPREIESLGVALGVAVGELDRIADELPSQTDRLAELLGLDRPAPPALIGQTLAAGKAVLARLVEALPLSDASAASARAMTLLGEFFAT